jgi:predicted permease
MIRSFYALQAVDPGFDPHNVVSMTVSVTGSPEGLPDRRPLFYRQLVEHVRTLPGVVSAAGINHLPIAGDLWTRSFIFEGRPEPRRGEEPNGVYRLVTPGYFETMRLPLLAGRDVSVNDDATGAGVVVINESAAKDYWPNENPIGKRFRFKSENGEVQPRITVIGVVKNAKQLDWAERIWDEFYFAAAQHDAGRLEDPGDHLDYVTLVVRARSDAAAIAPEIKKAVWSFDHNLPISNILTMERVVEEATAQQRFEMLLFGVFGAVALALAAAGIYGVMNYAVSRRTHEIGIRMSLGASRSDVLKLVVGQGIRQAIAGTVAGCAGALLLSRLMSKMLYGVRPTDPFTFGGVLVALGCAALIATLVPARKAACVEPAIALRND